MRAKDPFAVAATKYALPKGGSTMENCYMYYAVYLIWPRETRTSVLARDKFPVKIYCTITSSTLDMHGGKGSVLDLGASFGMKVDAIKMAVHGAVVCVVSSACHLAYLKKLLHFGKCMCFARVH